MITLTINLENEQLLNGSLQNIFESLSDEDMKEVAKQALVKYLTDVVDYDKERYKHEQIKNVRENGITGLTYSYYNKTKENIAHLDDNGIMNLEGFREIMNKYKSPKESQFEKLNELVKDELKQKANTFIKDNIDLNTLLEDQQNIVKENFPTMVSEVMTKLTFDFMMNTIQQAQMGGYSTNALQQINDRLSRNNIH